MPYPSEHAARIKEPGMFQKGSMRSKELSGGVRLILGKLDNSTSMTVQAVRFDKNKWTTERARKWLKDHDYKYISFEKATT